MQEDTGAKTTRNYLERWLKNDETNICPTNPLEFSLYFCGKLMKHLKGEFHLENQGEAGLSISGYIPIEIASDAEIQNLQPKNDIVSVSRNYPLILMAEDDYVNFFAQRAILEKNGFNVFSVQSGEAAIEWAPLLPISIIMLDMNLPDTSGVEVAKQVKSLMDRNIMPEIIICALSASDDKESRKAWQDVKIEKIFLKPIKQEVVQEIRDNTIPFNNHFYSLFDEDVRKEYNENTNNKLPQLIAAFKKELALFIEKDYGDKNFIQNAHSIKSAALTLGYSRLAAVMGAFEYSYSNSARSIMKENFERIRKYIIQEF